MLIIRTILIGAVLSCSACSTQVYEGAPRPEGEISVLSLLRSEPNMTFGGVVIDGRAIQSTRYGFSTDFQLLPGVHTLAFNYRIDADAYCDVREHLCPAIVVEGHCSGSFPLEAGKSYAGELVSRKDSVTAIIREALSVTSLLGGSGAPLAQLQCEQKSRQAALEADRAQLPLMGQVG